MLNLDIPPLEPLVELKNVRNGLPPVLPHFFVPRLADSPQNPIMDNLKPKPARKTISKPPPSIPTEVAIIMADPDREESRPKSTSNIWRDAMVHNSGLRNQALSWDRLRSSFPNTVSPTGFLSEQESLVFAAARYHVQPRLRDPTIDILYVTKNELLKALKMTVLGTSSVLHTWDASKEKFVQSHTDEGRQGFLLVDGKDDVISESLISRFVTIGTLLRRLEIFLATLRTMFSREGPTIHAYAHALSTIISYLRNVLVGCPPTSNEPEVEELTLSAVWIHYSAYEDILVALSALYHLEEDKMPPEYPQFDISPTRLLTHIYDHLNIHIERQSARIIVAIFAFILTKTSHEYFQQVSRSVGYGVIPAKKVSRVIGEKNNQYSIEDDDDEKEDNFLETLDNMGESFPGFFPPELLDILLAAQKSLVLLQVAQPDHSILKHTVTQGIIRWFWTEHEIETAWTGEVTPTIDSQNSTPIASSLIDTAESKSDFSIFKLFDLEPGSNPRLSALTSKENADTQSLEIFIDNFPHTLPPITPTLSHLTSLVVAPLVQHASTLANTLLKLFLSSTDTLNFQAHLSLLRSYLLLTAPPFKSRLSAALFSDTDDFNYGNQNHSRPLYRKQGKSPDQNALSWAVGLAPSLLERGTWPPVGADVSFFLRTVIVDSFESGKHVPEEDMGQRRVLEEAEYRLGFAIRDLPVDSGRDGWLNPLSIEALDFLYMDYKPPHPLEVLITPDILSKYQRMFAFIIRLMRVESALGALFRMTRQTSKPLFPTLATSRKLLLHFRFVAHSFVSNLSRYVFDTAIGGNFDPFIAQLSSNTSSTSRENSAPRFLDVFSLAQSHSTLLDDILSACLLRSGQRAVGDLLRHSLELILEFATIVGELYRSRLEEYAAAQLLEETSQKFYTKMATFTKVLRGLVDKGVSASKPPPHISIGDPTQRPIGGTDALYHLLIRLDIGEWWSTDKH